MEKLLEVMRRLRAPDGCPWDRQQTHESLRPYLLEEAAEAVDAIAEGDPAKMAEELGDVLLQVAFHSVIGEEEGTFGYDDVERAIVDKLIERHPHVFGDRELHTPEEVLANWEKQKEEKRGPQAPCEKVPRSLPALARGYELARKLELPASRAAARRALERGDLTEALWEVVKLFAAAKENPEVALRAKLSELCSNAP
ncbi:MazG family protein [Oceanithermus profundus DSM 14977]|uniref:MazG family protein n=1 Tax=Oceanithermus profundus (strain DSM 14977 / NBRC 100410 / VKM B-2274 / 506) TaxID=670487 RepID=E4U6X9_OCEP5|nr:MazG family protein [Oceanithermus profundus]ADR35982.1 MazG family protein [Oceanithermus profundus DSM 14977]